jgi:hypothetical protein
VAIRSRSFNPEASVIPRRFAAGCIATVISYHVACWFSHAPAVRTALLAASRWLLLKEGTPP